MPVQYCSPFDRAADQIKILSFPPSHRLYVLTTPADYVSVMLHWTEVGSMPCLGDECWHHDDAPNAYTYVAVRTVPRFSAGFLAGEFAILPICGRNKEFCRGDLRNREITVERPAAAKRGALTWSLGDYVDGHQFASFDLRCQLERLWTIRTAKLAVAFKLKGRSVPSWLTVHERTPSER